MGEWGDMGLGYTFEVTTNGRMLSDQVKLLLNFAFSMHLRLSISDAQDFPWQ